MATTLTLIIVIFLIATCSTYLFTWNLRKRLARAEKAIARIGHNQQ